MGKRPYDFSEETLRAVFARQRGLCASCGEDLNDQSISDNPNAHHVYENQIGDPNNPDHDWLRSPDNCVYLCSDLYKTAKPGEKLEGCHHHVGHNDNSSTGAAGSAEHFLFSHDGIENSPNHQAWAKSITERGENLYNIRGALSQMRLLQATLKNSIDLYSSEHKAQLDLVTQSFAGFWTNNLFNSKPPEIGIWLNSYSYILRSGTELSHGNLKQGAIAYFRARHHYLKALGAYSKWKDGIEGAGTKMQWAIGVSAVTVVASFVVLVR